MYWGDSYKITTSSTLCLALDHTFSHSLSGTPFHQLSFICFHVRTPIFLHTRAHQNNINPIQINHQLDATVSPVFYLTFIYSSICFGRPHAHHQELCNCSSSLWFYRCSVVIAVLLVVVGPAGRPDHDHYCSC